MRLIVGTIIFLLGLSQASFAEDDALKRLSAELHAIRGTHNEASQYDAGPELTPIKHLLRDWVEAQLPSLAENEDAPAEFADRLNAALKSANLTCEVATTRDDRCQESRTPDEGTQFNARGFVDGITLSYLEFAHYLVLKTGVGVRCGMDQSAYVYERRNKSWHLLLQTEQNIYDDKHYSPQVFFSIQSSPTSVAWNDQPPKPPLILTLGYSPWCSSNWQMLYTRLWRASPTNSVPAPLLDSADELFLGDEPKTASAEISEDDFVLEFVGGAVDGGVRRHVGHYLVHENSVERIAPVAFNPTEFVDEWLTRPWHEGKTWSEHASDMQAWYEQFHRGADHIFGGFDESGGTRCRADPTLWEVSFTEQAGPKNPDRQAYFLVRWMAPYRFTLVKIQKTRFPGCDVKDDMPDNLGTLFPSPRQ